MWGSPQTKTGMLIIDRVYYFEEFPMLDCSMYLLENRNGDLLLIDTGNGSSMDATLEAIQALHKDPKKITKILITHEHLDHVMGLYPLIAMLPTAPEILAHTAAAKILQEGDERKICPGSLGFSAAQFGVEIKPLTVTALKDGDTIKFGEFEFHCLETLGHSLGSMTFYEPAQKLLFPGDVVFPQGSFGRYDFPGGDLGVLQKSIKKLSDLDVQWLCAGHMAFTMNGSKHIQRSLRNIMYM